MRTVLKFKILIVALVALWLIVATVALDRLYLSLTTVTQNDTPALPAKKLKRASCRIHD